MIATLHLVEFFEVRAQQVWRAKGAGASGTTQLHFRMVLLKRNEMYNYCDQFQIGSMFTLKCVRYSSLATTLSQNEQVEMADEEVGAIEEVSCFPGSDTSNGS